MKNILPIFILLIFSCNRSNVKENSKQDLILNGKTFILYPEDDDENLTIQFLDSTCNLFEFHAYNQPWKLIKFEDSNALVLGHLIILLHQQNDSTITGYSIGEKETKLILKEQNPKWKLENILGKWTEEPWIGIENSKIPPPPARIPDHDTLWPPYYEIFENKIMSYCLGIDSTEIRFDNSLVYFNMKQHLHTDFVGYQNDWKILDINDSVMTIERRYTKEFFDANTLQYLDNVEIVRLIKNR